MLQLVRVPNTTHVFDVVRDGVWEGRVGVWEDYIETLRGAMAQSVFDRLMEVRHEVLRGQRTVIER